MQPDVGWAKIYRAVKEYDDGTLNKVIERKKREITNLEIEMTEDEPTRVQEVMLKTLQEDLTVYEVIVYLFGVPEDEFPAEVKDNKQFFLAYLEPLPRAVIDQYRRGLSDEDVLLEDKAMGYADDIRGLLTGKCNPNGGIVRG